MTNFFCLLGILYLVTFYYLFLLAALLIALCSQRHFIQAHFSSLPPKTTMQSHLKNLKLPAKVRKMLFLSV